MEVINLESYRFVGTEFKDGSLEDILCKTSFAHGKMLFCSFEEEVFDGTNKAHILILRCGKGSVSVGLLKDGMVSFYAWARSADEEKEFEMIESGMSGLKAVMQVFKIERGSH